MTSKKLMLVSLLVTVGAFTYSAANHLVSSLDEPQTEAMLQDLVNKSGQDDGVANLRNTLSASKTTPAIAEMRMELEDEDAAIAGHPDDAKAHSVSHLRSTLSAGKTAPAIAEMRMELEDEDVAIAGRSDG